MNQTRVEKAYLVENVWSTLKLLFPRGADWGPERWRLFKGHIADVCSWASVHVYYSYARVWMGAGHPLTLTRLVPSLPTHLWVRLCLKNNRNVCGSGVPITCISITHRHLLLSPRRKYSILILNYSLWYRVYITETSVTLGFLVHRIHYIP